MICYVENETEEEFDFDTVTLIETVVNKTFELENCPWQDGEINVLITDSEGIRQFNNDFRGIDKETDVLSFPNLEFDTPGVFSIPKGQEADYRNPDTNAYYLGDIVLNTERIRSQALEYGHSEKREMAFLVAHSCLHLSGYDHMEDEERIRMEKRQEAVLQALGITRE